MSRRIVFCNQRGGVGKTTTSHTVARYLADQGKRVLLIDTDPQGSLAMVLGLKPRNDQFLHQVMVQGFDVSQCVVTAAANLDVLCSDRQTAQTEQVINGITGREMVMDSRFPKMCDPNYDYVLIDAPPTITMLQNCALVFAKRYVITVAMDMLSLQGVMASMESARILNDYFGRDIQPIAIQPTMVDQRLMMTRHVMAALEELSLKYSIPLLHPIRIDATCGRAQKWKKFLVDYDPKAKATEDYQQAAAELVRHMDRIDEQQQRDQHAGQQTAA